LDQAQRERFAAGLAKVSYNEDLFRELAKAAAEDGPSLLAQLRESMEKQDLRDAAGSAFALKGLLNAVDGAQAAGVIQPMIDAALSDDAEAAERCLREADPELEQLLSEISQVAAGSPE
jgi:hypothetical protein